MTLGEWFSFEGRIPRRVWWLHYMLPIFVAHVVAALLDLLLGFGELAGNSGPIQMVVGLATLVGALAGGAKRWHDRDCSGWWQLVMLIPLIGSLWNLIVLGFLPGTPGPNRFGPDPLSPPVAAGAPPRWPGGGSVPPTGGP